MKNWLNKLIDQLRRNRTGLVLLKLSLSCETERGLPLSGGTSIPTCPLCGVVPLNWDVHNKWCPVVVGTKSSEKLLVGTNGVARMGHSDREPKPAPLPTAPAVAPMMPGTCGICGSRRFVVEQCSSPEAILDFIRMFTMTFYDIARREGFSNEEQVTAFWLRKIKELDEPLYFVRDTLMGDIVRLDPKHEAERQAAMYEALAAALGQEFRSPPDRGSHWHAPTSSVNLYRIAFLPDPDLQPTSEFVWTRDKPWPPLPESFGIVVHSGKVVAASNVRPQDLIGKTFDEIVRLVKSRNGEMHQVSTAGWHTCADWPTQVCPACEAGSERNGTTQYHLRVR